MQANSFHIVVKIDKALQKQKQEKVGSILIAPQYQYMLYYLQWGEVVSMGDRVHEWYPFVEEGDILLFHHTIEDDDWRLLDKDDDQNEYRIVIGMKENFNYEVFGCIKKDGQLIPDTQYIFINPSLRPLKTELRSDNIEIVLQDILEDEDFINRKIADCELSLSNLRETAESHTNNPVLMKEIVTAIKQLRVEMEGYTRKLNEKRLYSVQIIAINEKLSEEINVSQYDRIVVNKAELYPLDVNGQRILLANKDFVLGKWID